MPVKKSDYPVGVSSNGRGLFLARYRQHYLGCFRSPEEAAARVAEERDRNPIVLKPQPHYLVDPDIAEKAARLCWVRNRQGYIQRAGAGRTTVQMGNWAWAEYGGPEYGSDCQVDHINRDPSDNRRSNLRLLTLRGNMLNRCGGCVSRKKNRWIVRIGSGGKWFHRSYECEETARLVALHLKQKLLESETVFRFPAIC